MSHLQRKCQSRQTSTVLPDGTSEEDVIESTQWHLVLTKKTGYTYIY